MPLGQDLRTARLNRRLTLSQVAERTRIKFKILDAIENEDFSAIPAAIYAKGFIRLYAECVGLDPHQLIDEYVTRFSRTATAAPHLEKEMFTIDRNGIVTRRDSALSKMVEEEPTSEISTPVPAPVPVPAVETAPAQDTAHEATPAQTFQLVADEPSSRPVEPVMVQVEEVPAPQSRIVQPDLFDNPAPVVIPRSAPAVIKPTVEPILESQAATPQVKHEPLIVEGKVVPAPQQTTENGGLGEASLPEKPTTTIHQPEPAKPVEHIPSPTKPQRVGAPSPFFPQANAKPAEPAVEEPPAPGFAFKGFFITLATATILIVCLIGLSRLFRHHDVAPAAPPVPVKSPALRLAVDPPQPYFN